jgi:hypothetical protein
VLIAVPAACAVLAGCASTAEDRGFRVLSTSPATGALAAEAVTPALAGAWVYAVTWGDGAGASLVHRRAETDRYAAAWVNDEAGRRSEYWRRDETGNLVIPAVVDHDDGAITFFDPPLVTAYHALPPGRPAEQTFSMRVMDQRRPERLRDEGTGTQTIEYADDAVLETPLGRLATRRVIVRFNADLRMARAETTSTAYLVPGVGAAVIERRETVRLLGVPVRDREQTLVLSSAPVPLPLEGP